ncbi:hypothetical protein evm_011132 [Chilo suppressalis]|nr:hypothetical protein evm_011132 [Chilo suppressalis]
MSQENVSYSEASARFAPVRRSFADTARNDNSLNTTPLHRHPSPPLLSQYQFSSYSKTITQSSPLPAFSAGYNQHLHRSIVQTPTSQLPNGCAYFNDAVSNDNLMSICIIFTNRFIISLFPGNKIGLIKSLFSFHNSNLVLIVNDLRSRVLLVSWDGGLFVSVELFIMTEKYGSWTVCELKKELRRRNARLTGKKEDLIERLAAYDRNNNFLYNAVEDPVAEPFSNILWPPNEEFSSLQQSSNVPPIDIVHLNNYLLYINWKKA